MRKEEFSMHFRAKWRDCFDPPRKKKETETVLLRLLSVLIQPPLSTHCAQDSAWQPEDAIALPETCSPAGP